MPWREIKESILWSWWRKDCASFWSPNRPDSALAAVSHLPLTNGGVGGEKAFGRVAGTRCMPRWLFSHTAANAIPFPQTLTFGELPKTLWSRTFHCLWRVHIISFENCPLPIEDVSHTPPSLTGVKDMDLVRQPCYHCMAAVLVCEISHVRGLHRFHQRFKRHLFCCKNLWIVCILSWYAFSIKHWGQ